MTIKQKLKIILVAVGIMALSAPIATARQLDNERLICDGSPQRVGVVTKNYFIRICSQATNEGDIPVIYEAWRKKQKNSRISIPLVRETDEANNIYIALDGDYRYEVSLAKRRLLVTRKGKIIIKERIIQWCDFPGIANSCRF